MTGYKNNKHLKNIQCGPFDFLFNYKNTNFMRVSFLQTRQIIKKKTTKIV